MSTAGWSIEAAGASHPGQRQHNEDCWLVDLEAGFFIVADGVGGREAGEVASRIACDASAACVREGRDLRAALLAANQSIAAEISRAGRRSDSMASTAVSLHCDPIAGEFSLAWAGDSRLYLWDGQLKALTRDHSLVESLLRRGEIRPEEAEGHPRRNVILMALGDTQVAFAPGENSGSLPQDGLFLLCSDGLSDIVGAAQLSTLLASDGYSLQARADALVQAAVDAGGRDNITALLVSCRAADNASDGERTGRAPTVYETFDPATGRQRREEVAEELTEPTIRRVAARSAEAGTETQIHRSGREAPASSSAGDTGRSRWRLVATLLFGAALFLGAIVAWQVL